MNYFILRDGEQYGPYSQAEVQRYLRTGDIFPGDLSRTEEMNQWLPVSKVLGSAAPPPPSPDAACCAARSPNNASAGSATAFAATRGRLPPHPLQRSTSAIDQEQPRWSCWTLLRDWFRRLWPGYRNKAC